MYFVCLREVQTGPVKTLFFCFSLVDMHPAGFLSQTFLFCLQPCRRWGMGMSFLSWRLDFYQERGLYLAVNNLRCSTPTCPIPAHCIHSSHSTKLSTLCSLRPTSCTRLGPRNSLDVYLSGISAQLNSVGANCTLNNFPLLAEQVSLGFLPSMPQLPF